MSKSKRIGKIINNFEVVDSIMKQSKTGNRYLCYKIKCCLCKKENIVPASNLMRGTKCSCVSNYHNHGMSDSRLYNIYCGIIDRVENPKSRAYHHYGGRGIKMSDEWRKDFMVFYNWSILNGYNEKLTIDRIDVNGDYTPDNCRWVSMKEQQNNRRNNHVVNYHGEKLTLAQIAEKENINYHTLLTRIHRDKKTLEEALKT